MIEHFFTVSLGPGPKTSATFFVIIIANKILKSPKNNKMLK